MKSKKNIIFYLLVFVCILFIGIVFTTCSKSEDAQSIEYVSMWNAGEPEALFLIDMFEQFKEETGIDVVVSWAGRDNLNKLRTRFLSKDVPDLLDQGFSEMGALFQDEILLQPLDDLYGGKGPENQNRLLDLFDQNVLDLYKIDGKNYFFPLKIVTSGFFYDKTIFKQYDVVPPTTWDEFLDLCRTLKSQNFPPLALDGTIAFYNAYYFYWAVQRILGNGLLYQAVQDTSGELWRTNPGFLQAAEMVYQLSQAQEDFFQPGYSGSSWPAGQSDWAINKSGMILVGSWIASETKSQKTSTFDIGFFPFPLVEGGQGTIKNTEIIPFGFAIPKDAKNPDAAKQLLLFITREANQKKFVAMTDNFAPRIGIEYPDLLRDLQPFMEGATFHQVYDGVQQDFPEWLAIVFYPLDDRLISGQMTPQEFIERLSEDTATYWRNKE